MSDFSAAALRDVTDEELATQFTELALQNMNESEGVLAGAFRLVANEMQSRIFRRQLEATVDLKAAVTALRSSSERLETLTRRLIVLTVLLLIAAAPPAIEAISRCFR